MLFRGKVPAGKQEEERKMAKKQDSFYFDNFVACAEDSCRAAQMLKDALGDFHPEKLKGQLDSIHEVEHSADAKKHEMLDHLAKEFLPPIEREDIVLLSQNIDNMTDKVEDVMLRVYMNNVQEIEPNALKMTDIIIQCCDAVKELLREFRNFKKSKNIKQLVIRINDLEEEADKMFMQSVRGLYTESDDPLKIIAWRDIYIYLERCADACEHVADVVESVIMKNS